jgi:serine/threonine-protein kinase
MPHQALHATTSPNAALALACWLALTLVLAATAFFAWRWRRRAAAEDPQKLLGLVPDPRHDLLFAAASGVRLPANRHVGSYELVEVLGEGAMAAVFKARDAAGRLYAMKIPHRSIVDDEVLRKRFLREVAISSSLRHPNIVATLEHGDHEGVPYMLMELLAGQSLQDYLVEHASQAPDLDFAVRVVRSMAEALQAAHAGGVIHRDIKPSNVFVSDDGNVKLLDFGISRSDQFLTVLTLANSSMGTPVYMAPEQAGRAEQVDARADLYALGVLFYRLLTMHNPFDGIDPSEILARKLHAPPPPPSRLHTAVPPALETVVMKLLAAEPAARYQSATEVLAALDVSLIERERN